MSAAAGMSQALRVFHRPTFGRANFGYYRYRYKFNDTDYYYFNLGFSSELNEKFVLLLDAGPRYRRSRYSVINRIPGSNNVVSDSETDDDWGGSGRLSLAYTGEKTNWQTALSREITASSGQNQPVDRTELRFDWNHKLTWEWRGLLSMRYFINESDRSRDDPTLRDIDEDIFVAHPQIVYVINNDWSLRGSYRYTWKNNNENDTSRDRNQVLFELIYNWPIFE